MQSSSRLFPVQLVSAELIGSLVEDIYLLKPNNCVDRTVELAVTRLSQCSSAKRGHGQPIILLHGSFSNRRHWLSAEGGGVAAYLAEAGYDVWLPEMRGHGLSPVNDEFANNTLEGAVEYDLPAIHKFVVEQTGKDVTYIAEEMGGFFMLGALAVGAIDQRTVKSCIYIEEQNPLSSRLNTKAFGKNALWRLKKKGILSGQQLGVGIENESYATIKPYLSWQNRVSFTALTGLSAEQPYADITVPVMVVASKAADINGPVKNAEWIYEQLSMSTKSIKKYDYSEANTYRSYPNAGITLYPTTGGCWDDILAWVGRHECSISHSDRASQASQLEQSVAH